MAESPQHDSSLPKIPTLYPAFCKILTSAIATFWFLLSKEAAQPTKYKKSTSGSSARVFNVKSSGIHSALDAKANPYGLELFSIFVNAVCNSEAILPSINTCDLLIELIASICSICTGHASKHAAQFVHAQISSSNIEPPTKGLELIAVKSTPEGSSKVFWASSILGILSSLLSFISLIIFLGDNGFSVRNAGQLS